MLRTSHVMALALLPFCACAENPTTDVVTDTAMTPTTAGTTGGATSQTNAAPTNGSGVMSDRTTDTPPPADMPVEDGGQQEPPTTVTAAFQLQSPVLSEGGVYPEKYSCNGDDVLPPLSWGEPPAGTKSFVLTFTDLDADLNDGRFVHWALYNIPSGVRALPEDIGTAAMPPVPAGSTQVRGWSSLCGTLGGSQFLGPCPREKHDYAFKLYALSVETLEGASCNLQPIQVDDLVVQSGAVLAETTLTSTYTPPP